MTQMKHDTPNHPKMADLAERLQVPLYSAAGILELLWHYTAQYAVRGDIGRIPADRIAKALDWRGDPDVLMNALVASGWIDKNRGHKFIVHDWPDHCYDFVRKHLKRTQSAFLSDYKHKEKSRERVTGQRPVTDQSASGHRPVIDQSVTGLARGVVWCGVSSTQEDTSTPAFLTNSSKVENLSNTEETTTEVSPSEILSPLEAKLRAVAVEIWERHPALRRNRCSRNRTAQMLSVILKLVPVAERDQQLEFVNQNHADWCLSDQWLDEGGQFALGLEKWLHKTNGGWVGPPPERGITRKPTKSEQSLRAAATLFDLRMGEK